MNKLIEKLLNFNNRNDIRIKENIFLNKSAMR